MRRRRTGLRIAAGLALAATWAAPTYAGSFDGQWSVALTCPPSADGAGAFNFKLAGEVRDSVLHAERGQDGQPGWLTLDGTIQPSGQADLVARGMTGAPAYNISQTVRGVPYTHPVSAHFEGDEGRGQWVTTRVCDFRFHRQ